MQQLPVISSRMIPGDRPCTSIMECSTYSSREDRIKIDPVSLLKSTIVQLQ